MAVKLSQSDDGDDPGSDENGDDGDNSDSKILSEAKSRFKLSEEAENEIKRLALEDLEFRAGEQWPQKIVRDREMDGRPCLVINRIPQFIQQITNDQRQNRPAIKVHPLDNAADIETAKIIQGMIRHIEYNSNADIAYDTAFEGAVTGGFGYLRVVTDFVSPLSFDQEILIKRVRNPFSVCFDPASQEPDGSDAKFAFVIEDVKRDEYKAQYPESKLTMDGDWDSVGNLAPDWVSKDGVRVAEYFYKEFVEKEIVLLSNGKTLLSESLSQVLLPEDLTIVQKRTTQVPVIKWCKINGFEILEQTEWLGKYIPIIPVYGSEIFVNGKRILEGIVRNAKDSQRMLNYWTSAETETIALAPKAPYVAAEGQIEGYENDWETANRRNHSVLTYKPQSLNGTVLPAPQRNVFEPAVQSITQARMMAADDLKATTGIYDAALGSRSNETSGIAIQRRNLQTQTSNFHFIDNLTRSLRHVGRILVDLIPKVYDTARSQRIIGDDGEQDIVQINAQYVDPDTQKPVLYQLDAGLYDVAIDIGPSYASKRQEAADTMMQMSKAVPQLVQIAGDLMIRNMDWPGATEIADRMKKMLPPQLLDDNNNQPIPPQLQAKMAQQSQMIEGLTKSLNEANDYIDKKRFELESRERIEMKKLEVEVELELARLGAKDSLALLNTQVEQIDKRLKLMNIDRPIDADFSQGLPPGQMPGQAPSPNQGNPQGQNTDGALSAASNPAMQNPTGGVPPGKHVEGDFQ